MIHLPSSVRVYLCLTACDRRKSFDELHALVREHLELDAFAGYLFVFTSRRWLWLLARTGDSRTLTKILWYADATSPCAIASSGSTCQSRGLSLPRGIGGWKTQGALRCASVAGLAAAVSAAQIRARWAARPTSELV